MVIYRDHAGILIVILPPPKRRRRFVLLLQAERLLLSKNSAVLYCIVRSSAFLGLLGFLIRQLKMKEL